MKILLTGAAGFIGFHLTKKLIESGHKIWGVDSINEYYDVNLKYGRLQNCGIESVQDWGKWYESSQFKNYAFCRADLSNNEHVKEIFKIENFDQVIHLAAQPGVRYSLENPEAYIKSNIVGFSNVLEACRNDNIKTLLYASSSSVYGDSKTVPFMESQKVDNPISLYAATKKSNELMAYTYSHLYGIQTVGMRFFTVYGPWGRPDMAPMIFTKAALSNETIKVFNHGNQSRDFTYINDIVNRVEKLSEKVGLIENKAEIFNIGNGSPTPLMEFISILENQLKVKIKKEYIDSQPGDVKRTFADINKLEKIIGHYEGSSLSTGIEDMLNWYLDFCQVKKN